MRILLNPSGMFRTSRSEVALTLAFALALLLAAACLWPGLTGGFLFDDEPNLRDLSAYGGVTDWGTFRAFVWGGSSGPSGRPLALASFLLNDNAWPSNPASFKYTNILLHLLCGCLLLWATLQLCRSYGLPEHKAQAYALFSATAWLLHPFLVSTTLYAVQRMTQLAALFVFAGIAGYLHGRQLLAQRPRAGYVWMLTSLGLGTILGTLSKENGALLPLLLAVIEFCAPQTRTQPRPARLFLALCLWLPSLALLGYLLRMVDFSPNPWPHRNFNQPERLWTEARIVWDYLRNLFLPRIEGSGLYQDGLVISHGWLSPPSTLLAALGLLALFFTGIFARKPLPFLGLALLFFLAGHLLESTVVGLELYFEHRNYLPAAFLFLPIAQGLDALGQHISRRLVAGIAVTIVAMLAFLTYQRATLWGQPEGLEIYWALTSPDSPRAQNALANYYTRHGQAEKADAVMRSAMQKMPDSPLLTTGYLLQKVYLGTAKPEDFDWAAQRLTEQPFDAQAVMALRQLVDKVTQKGQPSWTRHATEGLLDHLSKAENHSRYALFPIFLRFIPYLKARLALADGRPDEAEAQYRIAMQKYGNIDSAMQMVAEMGNAGYPHHAMRLLDQAEAIYRAQSDTSLKFPRSIYDREIARIRAILQNEMR